MINTQNLVQLLRKLDFVQDNQVWIKEINGYELKIDTKNEEIIYPKGLKAYRDTTKNFSQPENFVVFECVHNLLSSGYRPEHIELEKWMPWGHGMTGWFCDIIVQDNDKNPYLLIECKTPDEAWTNNKEFSKARNKMLKDWGQLFNYYNSYRKAQWICLYSSDFYKETEKVSQTYHLISMQDNDNYLASSPKLRSFEQIRRENGGKEDYFKVWKETYQCDFISHNLFESEIFSIGNRPFQLSDLKIVDGEAIQKKYHQFATILRQYNISGRENAFDKLVNLFLCKVVDENKNPENLKVYRKWAASDDHFSLQDRLQKLYKEGMYSFLWEDVTYIEEKEIEEAFKLFKNKKDETKKTILEYFKQLKFYSNNAFAFLDVHNENLFLQNAVILREVVQMLQDIKLKNEEEQHQFLGDLFEGFLDQGVKQSEGQFFTPLPIVKFLISSLPLEQIIDQETAPKVIDYACGAGHFLTEYAVQIRNLVDKNMLKDHYQNIYGIEKEYRLSKVAKVSAFMYGQDQINIIYADALAQNKKIKDNTFSVLIANPPYSVKGFLSTLSPEDKQRFELYDNLNEDSFNAIETFFIEKAKQLLKTWWIAAIILPSSILTNGNIYVRCREIILKYFDLIAIAEFGSGTFSKTGTNTATLFLRKKGEKPDLAAHYANRVETRYNWDFGFDGLFEDSPLLASYCEYCAYDFDQYKNFLMGVESAIFDTEMFKEYQKEAENSPQIKDLKKKKYFKISDQQTQTDLLQKELIQYIKKIEQEKLYYYLLAKTNPNQVLIIKSPEKTEIKSFLGYERSATKGNEGIKYLWTTEKSDTDEAIFQSLKGIQGIKTPLLDPNDLSAQDKLNTYIRKHFLNQDFTISPENKKFVSLIPLTDMLDFSRTSFDKALRTSVQKKIGIKSKYQVVKLEDFPADIKKGTSITSKNAIEWEYKVVAGGKEFAYMHNEYNREENTITISASWANAGFVNFRKEKIFASDCTTIRGVTDISTKYIFEYLQSIQDEIFALARGSAQPHVYPNDIKALKIPLPPLEVQKQIIAECEKVDQEYETSRMAIQDYRKKISKIFETLGVIENRGGGTLKISELFQIIRGVIYSKNDQVIEKTNNIILTADNITEQGDLKIVKEIYLSENNQIDREKQLRKNDFFMCFSSGSKKHIGKLAFIDQDMKYYAGGFMGILRPKNQTFIPKYLYSLLNSESYRNKIRDLSNGTNINNLSNKIWDLKLLIPPFSRQQAIVSEIESYQAEIAKLENLMTQSASKKQAILNQYL